MAEFDEKQIRAHIKGGDFLPAYIFYGNEDYLKKSYADLLCEKAVSKEFFDFNFQEFDGKDIEDISDVFDAADMMPLMSEKRCVLVRDAAIEDLKDEKLLPFRKYLENPAQSTVLVFLQTKRDFSAAKAKSVIDLFRKNGAVCVLDKRKGNELIKPLISSASRQGCVLTPQAANYLVSVVGDDFNTLINELSKICSYASGGEITREQIDAVAVKTDEAKIYDLTKFLLAKNFDKAYETLSVLIRQKTDANYILGTIIGTYVDMYRAKISLACGKSVEELAETYSYGKNTFRLRNGARDSSRLDVDTLRKCLDVLSQADTRLKSSGDNPTMVLEQLMVKLFLVTGGEKV